MPEGGKSEGSLQKTDASGLELRPTAAVPTLPAGSMPATASPAEQPGSESVDQATPVCNSGVDRVDLLSAAVQRISTQLKDLTDVFNARLLYDRAKEEAFERLYSDLDQLKKNAAQDNIKPLLLDLILLYDRMDHAHREAASTDGADGSIVIRIVKSFIDELLEVLYRRDVGLIEVLSPAFDPSQQRAIGVEIVEDPAQNQRVATIVRRGFWLGSRILRPEDVIVRRYVKPTTAQPGDDS
jgi:molecular chaperone GrpE